MKLPTENKGTQHLLSRLTDYLFYFEGQEELGLIICADSIILKIVCEELTERGLHEAPSWKEVLRGLQNHEELFTVLKPPLQKEMYDTITQYHYRRGIIQIMDRETLTLNVVTFNPNRGQLILVATIEALKNIEKDFFVKDKVGLIECF